jgi:hypothetical protein
MNMTAFWEKRSVVSKWTDVSEVRTVSSLVALMMEVVHITETSVFFNETTRRLSQNTVIFVVNRLLYVQLALTAIFFYNFVKANWRDKQLSHLRMFVLADLQRRISLKGKVCHVFTLFGPESRGTAFTSA